MTQKKTFTKYVSLYKKKKKIIITKLIWKYNSLKACENQDIDLFKKICHSRKLKKEIDIFSKAFMFQEYSLEI